MIEAMHDLAERLEQQDDAVSMMQAMSMRAQISLLEDDAPTALRQITGSLRGAYEYREHVDMIIALQPVAMGLLQLGRPELGARLIGISDGEAERYGIMRPASMSEVTGVANAEGLFIDALGEEAFKNEIARSRRMTLEDALLILEELVHQLDESPG